jgi:Plavaka transposase
VLHLPGDRFENVSEDVAPKLEIKGLWYCSLVDVIKSAFAEVAADHFHLQPFKLYWQDPDNPNTHPVHLFSELYNSDAFLEEHSNVMTQSQEPGCKLEKVIAAMMLWSDSTHLASFGNSSLWPIYLYFGNLSKYWHGKPTLFGAHHIAYIPLVCICRLGPFICSWHHTATRYNPRYIHRGI